ncbi:MAG TPA: TIGR02147 family protein [Bdellovibrionales bacterium]|nr:TIGR02147 family protein [Bdellovibrionales bacterium]
MKSENSLFGSDDYKDYLRSRVGKPGQRKGVKSAMARALNCQPTYITSVLYGAANLSLEQAEALNSFFAHTKEESQFFLLMVSRDRAGTQSLKSHFQEQCDQILKARLVLTKRLGQQNPLNEQSRGQFYSSWHYLAVQIALTIPEYQDHDSLAKALDLPSTLVAEVLQFLCETGLVEKRGSKFFPTATQIRLGNDSHHIRKHHTNWRIKALESLDRESLNDLHYSGVVSLSEVDVVRIKDTLLKQLKENLKVIADSKEQKLYVLNLDFFNLTKTK